MSDESTSQIEVNTTQKEVKTKKRAVSSKRTKGERLPWWVELFFVQIGLPEKLLLKLLNIQKRTKGHFSDNFNAYKIIGLISILTIYTYPLIKQSKNENTCVRQTLKVLKTKSASSISPISEAVNYCKGGTEPKLYNF